MLMPAVMRFGDWLSKTGTSQEKAAEALGITQGRVSQLVLGGWPGREVMLRIRAFTKGEVTADDFLPEAQATEIPSGAA